MDDDILAEVLHSTRRRGEMKTMSNQFIKQSIPELELARASYDEINWEVQFSSKNLDYVAEWTVDEIERIVKYQSNAMDYIPEATELKRYFSTLMNLRVKVVRKEALPTGVKTAFIRRLFIPARYAVILSMVGEVVYPDVAVRILPKYKADKGETFMTMDELQDMSIRLEKFFGDGLCGVLGMSLDRYGDPHYMNKIAIVEGQVLETIKSVTKDNPLYGFMAWLMNAELLDVAYQEARYLLRVNYSAPGIYRSNGRLVWQKFSETENSTKNNEPTPEGSKNVFATDKQPDGEDTNNNNQGN